MICSGCGRSFDRYHDWEERWVRDRPTLDAETHIHLQRFRVDCPDCGRVVERLPWLAKRARDAGRRRIEAVAIDMNGAYEAEVRAQCPQAEIVFEQFHVLAKYGREVIDRVRVDEAKRLAKDKPARKVVRGSLAAAAAQRRKP